MHAIGALRNGIAADSLQTAQNLTLMNIALHFRISERAMNKNARCTAKELKGVESGTWMLVSKGDANP
jgi:hypothetical protein